MSTPEALPPFRASMSAQPAKVVLGGSARQVTANELPIAQDLAGVNMWLDPGAVRELHWHANAAEWGYVMAGSVRVTLFDPEGRIDIADANTGDVFYFPRGYGHAIQNNGATPTNFLLVFDNGHFSEFATFSSTDWLAHTPVEVIAQTLGVSQESLGNLPKGEAYIVPGPVPPPLAEDRPETPQPATPLSHAFAFAAQPAMTFPGGTMTTASMHEFPVSTTITGVLMTLAPGGMREPHWHPNAAEWLYVLSGSVRATLFGSRGRAATETFCEGDVGYFPMGYGHYLQNVGDEECRLLVCFNSGEYKQISLSGWLAANPRQLVATNFSLPLPLVNAFPDTTETIAGG